MCNTNWADSVKSQKMIKSLKFRIKEVKGLLYLCSENISDDQLHVTAHVFCPIVFAYAKAGFLAH